MVLSECLRVTGNSHDAEDASQLAFLALAIEIKSGTTIRSPSSWLQRVARRQASKIVRARGRLRRREDQARRSELHLANGEAALDAAVTSGIVRDAIDRLPERYRLPVILHYFGGMSLERIADELKLKRPAVATRLHRGRKMLADRLGRHGVRLDNATLAGLLAVLVPTAVVSSVVAAARGISVSGGMQASATTIGISIAETLRAVAWGTLRRPMRNAIVVAALACTTSTMAWVAPRVFSWERVRGMDPRPVIQRILHLDSAPRLRVSNPPAAVALRGSPLAPALSRPAGRGRQEALGAAGVEESVPAMPVTPRIASAEAMQAPRAGGIVRADAPVLPAPASAPEVRAASIPVAAQRANLVIRDQQVVTESIEAGSLTLGPRVGDRAELGLTGELLLTDPGGHVTIGEQGSGALYLGNETAPGAIRAAPGVSVPFVVRQSPGARGLVQGWGTVATNGPLINNGRVVADGFDHYRELDFSGASSISHTIPSPGGDGASGWFVQRGGKLKLPALKIEPGTRTYTWGDSERAPTLELVNSLRLTVHDQPAPAEVSVALRTVALDDPLDLALPGGTTVIGLWQFDASASFDPRQLDVLVRYDDRAAGRFFTGESGIQLMASKHGGWALADNVRVDVAGHRIWGTYDGPFDYLAVAIPWDLAGGELRPSSLGGISAVTPEPASGLIGLGVVGGMALRRRRK
jgi:RNA polymerase sigma factor (sigma-70 family)